jgi:Tfp pilus assembly protein PilF
MQDAHSLGIAEGPPGLSSCSSSYEELLKQALLLEQAGELQDAQKIFEYCIRVPLAGSDAAQAALIRFQYGLFWERQKDEVQAKAWFEQSIAFAPTLEASTRLAGLYLRQNADLLAAKTLEKALGLAANKAQRFMMLKSIGNCYFRCEEVSLSKNFYQLALKLEPGSSLVRCNLGFLAVKQNDLPQAKQLFEQAYASDPKCSKALGGLALCYYLTHQLGCAHEYFGKALQLDLNQPVLVFYLVRCAFELKSYSLAESMLASYMDRFVSNPDLQFSLACLQYHLGKFEQLKVTLDSLLRVQPQHALGLELNKKLQPFLRPSFSPAMSL